MSIIGELGKAYTDAEAEVIGKGKRIEVLSAFGRQVFKLLKNAGATTLTGTTAKGMATKINDLDAFYVEANTTMAAVFGGLRQPYYKGNVLTAPENLATGYWGWFLVRGYALGMFGDTATALSAGDRIVLDDDADPGRVGGLPAASVANLSGAFARAVAASAGVADEVVPMYVIENPWGD